MKNRLHILIVAFVYTAVFFYSKPMHKSRETYVIAKQQQQIERHNNVVGSK